MLVLALATPALAVDLDVLVEAWTLTSPGAGGSDRSDEARAVGFVQSGNIVSAGWRDGAPGYHHDGYAVEYQADGTLVWEIVEDAGPIGTDRLSSDDRFWGLAIEPTNSNVALCGGIGPADLGDPDVRWFLEARISNPPTPPTSDWRIEYVDGVSSPVQECRGVAWLGGFVYGVGWADSGTEAGRWYGVKAEEGVGTIVVPPGPIVFDDEAYVAVPDQALAVAVDAGSGSFAVVGARGFSGLPGSDLNDTDWHVRYFDPDGTLVWEDTYAGPDLLEDLAVAAVIEPANGDLFVAGWTNTGADNADGADLDWRVTRYSGTGDPYGGPEVLWSRSYESAAFASEGATALVLDENQDLLVGGWAIDPATGRERWRIAKLDTAYGDELQEWLGTVRGGDARLHDLDVRDGRVAMAGSVDDGKGEATDYATAFLDFDLDEDGVADAVDACPSDPEKSVDSGVCGCGILDNDTDLDGVLNCLEECDSDPTKTEPIQCPNCDDDESDPDGDGVANCIDDCDEDPEKTAPGVCGCGAPDSDSDGDGVLGCDDGCSNTPPGTEVDEFGCPLPQDTGTPGTTTATDGDDKGGGCGCAGAPHPAGGAVALALGVLLVRRRDRKRSL